MDTSSQPRQQNPSVSYPARFQKTILTYLTSELRNPLNVIVGYCQILLEDTIDLDRNDFVSRLHQIQKESAKLQTRINNFMDPSKLEEEGIEFDPDTIGFVLRDRFRDALDKICRLGDELLKIAQQGRQDFLHADVQEIHQAIQNFRITVENPKSLSGQPKGVRDLISDTYSVLSVAKSPSTAWNSFKSTDMEDKVTAEQASILVVDDHPLNRSLLSRLFERQGHFVYTAANGMEALELVRSHVFDLILLDVIMPGMSGFDVLKHLKADPAYQSIPVLMLSAIDERDMVLRCIEHGADDYLFKPFNPVLLRARISASIEKKRLRDKEQKYFQKIEDDLTVARKIQKNFLPERLPSPPGWEIAALFQPARHVAGDFYDVFPLCDGGQLGIAIGDVCGKGVSAALFMGLFRSFLRMFSDLYVSDTSDQWSPSNSTAKNPPDQGNGTLLRMIVEQLNNFISNHHGKANMFATLFFGILEPTSGSLVYVNGGNEPPIILTRHHQKRHLTATGPMVGMLPNMPFQTNQTRMEPGDTLVAFTDGITEAKDPSGNELKDGYLMEMIEAPAGSANELVDRFKTYFNGISTAADPLDDLTMLIVKRVATHSQMRLQG